MEYMNNSKKIIVLKYGSATIEDQSIEQYAKQIKNLSADWSPVIVLFKANLVAGFWLQ